jgi:hypothetical protein
MEPVTALAESCRVGIFAVTHPPKAQDTAMNAFTGSMAFVASARIAFIVIDEPETERRLMLPVKNNVGIKAQGRGYSIAAKIVVENIGAPYIIWDDAPVDMTAGQAIVAAAKHAKEGRSLKYAKEFPNDLLADGPCGGGWRGSRRETKHKPATLTHRVGIIAQKDDFSAGWSWTLP